MFYKNLAPPHEPGLASHCPLCGDWSQGGSSRIRHTVENTSHIQFEYMRIHCTVENIVHDTSHSWEYTTQTSWKYSWWYITQFDSQITFWRIHHTVDHTLDYTLLTGKYHKSWRLTVLHDSICNLYIFNWLSFQTFKIWQCPCGQIYFAWQLTTDQPEPPVVLLLSC